MKKSYFIALCIISLVSCSAPGDELQDFNESEKSESLNKTDNNMLARGGFRGDPSTEAPPEGIWSTSIYLTKPIYGFYSPYTKKYLYGNSPLASELPKSYTDLGFYGMDRFLGSADGNGPVISSWFNTVTNDLVLTTNSNKFNGQSNWEKKDVGTSYNGDEPGSYPIYSYFNSDNRTHFYTRDKNELGDGKNGFVYLGISFYLKESGPKPFRVRDGNFFQDNKTGAVYIVFESILRRIDSWSVINTLFDFKPDPRTGKPKDWKILKVNIEEYTGERGADINSETKLVQNTNDGKIYMVDGGFFRYIPTMQIFNLYNFNEDAIQKRPIRMMAKDKDIAHTY